MSGDERGGPYLRDKQGFRKPPAEDLNRLPFWWEVLGFYLFKYWWVVLLAVTVLVILLRQRPRP